jgi:hypothetical protein
MTTGNATTIENKDRTQMANRGSKSNPHQLKTNKHSIALVYYCKTVAGWRRFPATVVTNVLGEVIDVKHSVVVVDGQEQTIEGGRYQFRQFVDGQQKFTNVTSEYGTKHLVHQWNKVQRVANVQATNGHAKTIKAVLAEFLKHKRTVEKYVKAAYMAEVAVNEFLEVCSTPYIRSVTAKDVNAFITKMRERGLSDRTVANKWTMLKG